MNNKRIGKLIGAAVIILLLTTTLSAIGVNVVKNDELETEQSDPKTIYGGQLRVYVVEIISRWDNYYGDPYHYAFLDFAIDEKLSIEYNTTYNTQVTWDAQQAGYENVTEDNIIVMAAIFNPKSQTKYSLPPVSYPFKAYYVDAAAAALGQTQ